MTIRGVKFGAAVILFTSVSVLVPEVVGTYAGAATRTVSAKFCREAEASSVKTSSVVRADKAVDDMRSASKIAPKPLKSELLKLADDLQHVLVTGKVTKKQEAAIEGLASKVRPKIKSLCGKD
jgi:hypothetical protein